MEFTLEFERPLIELQKRIEALREIERSSGTDLSAAIAQLQRRAATLREQIFSSLSPWQETLLSRHPARPYMLDYVEALCTDWMEIHGDRGGYDDRAIVCGLARLGGAPVTIIGH